jgi:hypothetical protein
MNVAADRTAVVTPSQNRSAPHVNRLPNFERAETCSINEPVYGDTSAQVLKFTPQEEPRSAGHPMEESGQAIVAKIQKAADLANENCDRAMALAHKLAMQIRAAEDIGDRD